MSGAGSNIGSGSALWIGAERIHGEKSGRIGKEDAPGGRELKRSDVFPVRGSAQQVKIGDGYRGASLEQGGTPRIRAGHERSTSVR